MSTVGEGSRLASMPEVVSEMIPFCSVFSCCCLSTSGFISVIVSLVSLLFISELAAVEIKELESVVLLCRTFN